MPIRIDSSSADFAGRFKAFLAMKREVAADIETAVRGIVGDVIARGDAALIEATAKFDRLTLDASGLRITPAEIDTAIKACDPATLEALTLARDRIEVFHQRQLPKDDRFTDALGVELGHRWTAIDGSSQLTETIFENRFMHVQELARFGARIHLDGETATIEGIKKLRGAPVMATDLRASVSLVIAALAAEGETMVNRVYHLDRGFERLEDKLSACGATIERISG